MYSATDFILVDEGKHQQLARLVRQNIVRAVEKTPKTTVSDVTSNLPREAVKVSQYIV